MLLAIDAGNTQMHIGMFRDEELLESFRVATDRLATADTLGAMLSGLLRMRNLHLAEVEAAIVSSVVPQLNHEFELLSERYFKGSLQVVGPGLKTGMPIRMDNPHEVGADRIVNAVAAHDRFGGACISVDFGTTINYDVVSEAGELLGAIFTPGVEISIAALAERAAALPNVDIEPPRELIGRSTITAIQSGIVYGFAGQVDGIVGRIREELGVEAQTVATGGLADLIAPHARTLERVDPHLTLEGLRLVWARNA